MWSFTSRIAKRLGREDISYAEVCNLIASNDVRTMDEFRKLMKYLSVGIVNLLYTYNPSSVVIGDELSEIGEPVLIELQNQLKEIAVSRVAVDVKVELAQLDFDSAYIGAAMLATRYVFDHISDFFEKRN